MIAQIQQALSLIHIQIFLFSMVLFFIGYTLAPIVYFKEIKVLLAYPLWIARQLDKIAAKKWHPAVLFVFILSINAFSLFIDLISGYIPGLPFLFAIWMGLNIGVVTYHTLEGHYYFISLLNPVALFELPAAFLAFSLAIKLNCSLMHCSFLPEPVSIFQPYLQSFVVIILPLLVIAGIIETFAIRLAQKVEDEEKAREEKQNENNAKK